ncbi:MAG: hypothetical protein MPW16_01625 [Candidatus Manganitrophus sp.]|nr:MAG: hypothetical protein MPW16_01625 [Candidatus Manganitrophus sp.]
MAAKILRHSPENRPPSTHSISRGTLPSEWFVPIPSSRPATRAIAGKKMELYAGMVENLDFHVGRLIDHLKKIGEYENTSSSCSATTAPRAPTFQNAGRPVRATSCSRPSTVADPSQCVGRSGFLRRLRPDVGAGVDDPLQPVQGLARGRGIRNVLIVSGPAVKRPKGSIPPPPPPPPPRRP